MSKQHEPFPLFKGATRVPTIAGVPVMPLMIMFVAVASIAMLFSLWCWFLAVPMWLLMAEVTRKDDRAFRIWGLWIETVILPFLVGVKSRNYAAIANLCFGVMPPMAMFGLVLL